MTHPHGLTRQDVAHLKAGDEVTFIREMATDNSAPITSVAYADSADGSLWCAGYLIRRKDGDPAIFLVEVISPKPPTPPMAEPTWLGAVVMTSYGPCVRAAKEDDEPLWVDQDGDWCTWDGLASANLRPLTPAERRDLGIPEMLPEGWVAVDARDIDREHLGSWMSDHWPDDLHIGLVQDVARAELARREATA